MGPRTLLLALLALLLLAPTVLAAAGGPERVRAAGEVPRGGPPLARRRRLARGRPAPLSEFPFQAYLEVQWRGGRGDTWCGGALVGARVLVTAAHCVHRCAGVYEGYPGVCDNYTGKESHEELVQSGIRAAGVRAWLGSERYRGPAARAYEVTAVEVFERPPRDPRLGDIAALRLNESVPLQPGAAEAARLAPGAGAGARAGLRRRSCAVSGWGLLADGRRPQLLQFAEPRVLSLAQCRLLRPSLPADTLCSNRSAGYSTAGDSGGPLLCGGLLTGLVRGEFDARLPGGGGEATLDTYTAVAPYRAWLSAWTRIWDLERLSSGLARSFSAWLRLTLLGPEAADPRRDL